MSLMIPLWLCYDCVVVCIYGVCYGSMCDTVGYVDVYDVDGVTINMCG